MKPADVQQVPQKRKLYRPVFANYGSVKACQTLLSIVTINLLHLQTGHPAISTKPYSQYMAHMTGEHCSAQRSERMKLKLSLHSQFWMIKMRMSQDISYTDCLLVAWHHMQSTCLIGCCKSVIIVIVSQFFSWDISSEISMVRYKHIFDVWKLPLSDVNSKVTHSIECTISQIIK